RRIAYEGRDLKEMSEAAMRTIRGRHISMIMQDPRFSLNPVMRVGPQIAEMLRVHADIGRTEAIQRTLQALASVRMKDPERVMHADLHRSAHPYTRRLLASTPHIGVRPAPCR